MISDGYHEISLDENGGYTGTWSARTEPVVLSTTPEYVTLICIGPSPDGKRRGRMSNPLNCLIRGGVKTGVPLTSTGLQGSE